MKPKYKLGQQVYALRISQGSLHVYQGIINSISLHSGQICYGLSDASNIPERRVYKSKKTLKTAFNQAFERLNNVGEPF